MPPQVELAGGPGGGAPGGRLFLQHDYARAGAVGLEGCAGAGGSRTHDDHVDPFRVVGKVAGGAKSVGGKSNAHD